MVCAALRVASPNASDNNTCFPMRFPALFAGGIKSYFPAVLVSSVLPFPFLLDFFPGGFKKAAAAACRRTKKNGCWVQGKCWNGWSKTSTTSRFLIWVDDYSNSFCVLCSICHHESLPWLWSKIHPFPQASSRNLHMPSQLPHSEGQWKYFWRASPSLPQTIKAACWAPQHRGS